MKKFLPIFILLYSTSSISAGRLGIPGTPLPCLTEKCKIDKILENSKHIRFVKTRHLTIELKNHSHVATLSALIERDMSNRRLGPEELNLVKSDYVSLIAGIRTPGSFLDARDEILSGIRSDVDRLTQEQLAIALASFTEMSKSMGQDLLAEATSNLMNRVSPSAFNFLAKEGGYGLPTNPHALNPEDIDVGGLVRKMIDSQNIAIESHATGLKFSFSTKRSAEDGKWTDEDRAYAAVIQALKRGAQAAGAVGTAGGFVGGPPTAIAGGTLAGTAGAMYGVIEGYNNPELADIKPSGVETTTRKEVKIEPGQSTTDEKTGIVTTTTQKTTTSTVTKKDLETGKVTEEVNTVVEKEVNYSCAAGVKCDLSKVKNDNKGCNKPDNGFGNLVLTEEQQEIRRAKFRERLAIMRGALILVMEPDYERGKGGLTELFKKVEREKLINPGFPEKDKNTGAPTRSPIPGGDGLFDPKPVGK